MSVIVRDDGFHEDDFTGASLDIAPETDAGHLPALIEGAQMIRVLFPAFSDGRGFTLARRIRALGFTGRLRAAGPLIADQYPMARRVGFDEVEIPPEMAERQPSPQWLFRADWAAHDYRARLAG
ncbi:DUF934 domain-containing protein [Thioclava pacifica]|uniref:Oxidoreductase n=1 Tax=Thioclava pacifica DSM 10166 TaxID=1353537 RepID=A0A074JIP3_9RHOB|nr:DUF934 domain-containing protein [Thioclava pacifica]KEO56344.1 hypothetical protein TP2_02120 [Thioclava pacifica DSM 10166]